MDKSPAVTKFVIDQKSYYAQIIWEPSKEDWFHIKLYDDCKCWSGKFTYECANKAMDRCDQTEDQYFTTAKKALSHPNDEFTYTLDIKSNNDVEFCWKMIYQGTNNKFRHGSLHLHSDGVNDSKDILLDILMAENNTLRNKIDSVCIRNEELTSDLNKCKTELDKFVDIKTSLEESLYSKFVQVLNTKKRRIELLEAKVDNLTDEL